MALFFSGCALLLVMSCGLWASTACQLRVSVTIPEQWEVSENDSSENRLTLFHSQHVRTRMYYKDHRHVIEVSDI